MLGFFSWFFSLIDMKRQNTSNVFSHFLGRRIETPTKILSACWFSQRFAISFEHLLSSSGPLTVFSQRRGHRRQQMDGKRSCREWQQSKFLLWTCLDYWNIDIFMFSQKIIFVYQNFLYFPRIWAKWRINLSLSEGALMLSVTLTTPRDQETREISTSKAPQNLKRVI